jgi:hypothetical protein
MIQALLWLALIPAGSAPGLSDAELRKVVVTLERRGCYGECPIYQLRITGDGKVSFHGERFVKRTGSHAGTISPEKVRKLVRAFEEAGYFAIRENYGYGGCGTRQLCATGFLNDAPGADTSITLRGRTHRVTHDYGCTCAPSPLFKLEHAIDEIVGTDRWVGKEKGGQRAGSAAN